jgi:hypothetical protein
LNVAMKALITKPIEMYEENNERERVVYVSRPVSRNGSVMGTIVVILIASVLLIFAFAISARLIRKLMG